MKHLTLLFIIAAFLFGVISCEKIGDEDLKDNPYKELSLTTKAADLASKGNTFAFNFIDRVNDAVEGDYIISPLSMQFLLGMVLNGAREQTADEICSVLGYGKGEVDAVNDYCLSMLKQLPDLDKKTKLTIANAIFANKNYTLLNNYKTDVGKFYEAEVANLDFSKNSSSTKTINKWCSDHTEGLIPEIIDNVDPSTLAYLLNAMYFKSQWHDKFPKGNTSKETFTDETGAKTTVQMMKNENGFAYQDDDVIRAVRLPYGNGAYSMTVILPVDGKTLSDVTNYLEMKTWEDFQRRMVMCDVDLWLPRFETKFYINLNDILSAMGMQSAFDPVKADFKAMSDVAMCLSIVKQKAMIKVDEEGTEAAVVSMAAGLSMASFINDHIVFHADRPFLYLITESSTGVILFAGKFSGR